LNESVECCHTVCAQWAYRFANLSDKKIQGQIFIFFCQRRNVLKSVFLSNKELDLRWDEKWKKVEKKNKDLVNLLFFIKIVLFNCRFLISRRLHPFVFVISKLFNLLKICKRKVLETLLIWGLPVFIENG
jgi:hypothetical protein